MIRLLMAVSVISTFLSFPGANSWASSAPLHAAELNLNPSWFSLPSREQSVGYYSDGSLINPANLPLEGLGFLKILRHRDRGWSADLLQQTLLKAAAAVAQAFPAGERIQIGDIAQSTGGNIGTHASHQNGLDMDITYLRVNRREQDPAFQDGFDELFVENGRVTSNFDAERNWEFAKSLVSTGKINRIFVDVNIKRLFCDRFSGKKASAAEIETLRRLRPWPSHDNHMHVRTLCPPTSPRCVAQNEPEHGDGCAELKDWDKIELRAFQALPNQLRVEEED